MNFNDEEIDRLLAGERVEITVGKWYMLYEVGRTFQAQRRSRTLGDYTVDAIVKIIGHRSEQRGKGRKRPQFNHIFTFEAVKQ